MTDDPANSGRPLKRKRIYKEKEAVGPESEGSAAMQRGTKCEHHMFHSRYVQSAKYIIISRRIDIFEEIEDGDNGTRT